MLIAPATPCSATPIGAEEMVINGQPLPVRASMGMLTQPISFLGLPVVTVPLRTASGKPIGLQLIAAPFNEQACLRAARASGSDGHYRCPSGGECSMINLDNVDRPAILAEVTAAFYQYEEALVSNNIEALDALFWHDPRTVRLGAGENLYGIEAIRAFRAARPAAGLARDLRHTTITTFGADMAVCSTEFTRGAAPARAASSRHRYASLRLADCRRPCQSDGLSGVYGSGPETKVSTGPLPVR